MAVDYKAAARQFAQQAGIDPNVFAAQIGAESNWNPSARSPAGALGIAQIMPATARGWNVDPMNPLAALRAAAQNMGRYYRQYGNYEDALEAYNAGPGAVIKGKGIKYNETRNYVAKILGNTAGQGFSAPAGINAGAAVPSATGGGLDRRALGMAALSMKGQGESFTNAVRRAWQANPTGFGSPGGAASTSLVDGPPAAPASPQGAAASHNAVVRLALEQQGTPYSWGGGTPSGPSRGFGRGANTVGFDCSSLVQYAWAKAGVKLPRTTYDQIKSGTAVPNLSQARPGDLLFPHAGHVQMYIGNGKVVEAPYTGARVRVTNVGSKYIAIRRPG